MPPRALSRLLLGFLVGAAAGGLAGLLRTPDHAPVGSSARDAAALPQERFGDPPGDARQTPEPGTPHVEQVDLVTSDGTALDEDATPPPRMATAPADPHLAAGPADDGASGGE